MNWVTTILLGHTGIKSCVHIYLFKEITFVPVVCDGFGDARPTTARGLSLRTALLGLCPHHHVLEHSYGLLLRLCFTSAIHSQQNL